jgi:TolB-like protein
LRLLAELQRRNVIRMAGLYLVGAWLLVQVAATLLPVFGAPEWVMKVLVGLLAFGFLAALVFSWIFELTPDGLKRDGEVTAAESITPQTARRMDRVLLLVMALALGYFALDKFVLAPAQLADAQQSSASSTAASGKEPDSAPAKESETDSSAAPVDPKSVAVLAFADLSAEKDSEYFADGIAEEILNALAQVKDLKVAGRTSSFYFKGRNDSLQIVGNTLGVAHVLEGSVRRQGDKVRISAKLVQVSDGIQLWSESFDGDMGDVFALQERIARAITDKLQIALSGKQVQQLVNAGTDNAEAYALYLQASATFNRRDSARYPEATAQLQQAITLDPDFARAYARMAALYAVALNGETVEFDKAIAESGKYAQRASQLDPTLAEPHAALALTFRYQRRNREAFAASARALALEPDDVTTNFWHALTLIQSGYRRQGIAGLDRTLQLDPLLPNALFWRSREHIADGELDQAERLLRRAAESGHSFVGVAQAQVDLARGNRDGAVSSLTAGLEYFSNAFPAGTADVFARAWLGDAEAKARALAAIDAYLASKPPYVSGVASYVLVHAGEPARGLLLLQENPSTNDALLMGEIFAPPLAAVRRLPEFPEFVRRMGLAAYWDEAGPPEQCKKDASGDYRCE